MTSDSGSAGQARARVVVADDHPLFREGVVRVLSGSGRVDVVAQAADGLQALSEIREHLPDVAVLDYRLPLMDGVEVTHAIVRDQLATRVLLLSAYTDSQLVYRAIQKGASGYLAKEARREEILDAVLACAKGEPVLPSEVAAGLVSEIRIRAIGDVPALTQREAEIVRLIAAGNSNSDIASELHVAATTVKTHLQHVYEKLGVSDRAAAVAAAIRAGLIE